MKLAHPSLEGADFALVHFKLRMVERSLFTAQLLLGMRAGLLKAARRLESVKGQPYADLVDPQVDFHEAHQHQKPAPAFVLVPPAEIPLEVAAGSCAFLTFRLFGRGVQELPRLIELIAEMGEYGVEAGLLRFTLECVESEDASGNRRLVWMEGEGDFAPALIPLSWWLEDFAAGRGEAEMAVRFDTPARLMSHGKPLFQPGFGEVFPFMLRRVTSMLYYYCQMRGSINARRLVDLANGLETTLSRLEWRDWKSVAGQETIGGVVGELAVSGPGLEDLWWVVALGSLLNIGKGAAFGAGRYAVI
ncbi:MAG: CRISPR system precrRNA processing endoribonuclease RAMP protein Cas6 [Deltaproteobacteria bacterium]|jgi:hypothetical protein|nr:CRISPR system precrRNA processing endoribonuclease RAMP protein Cas6 [Deltaproteobacteria bacterium]